jgi:hypothetical protein
MYKHGYNKKYILEDIEEFGKHNPIYDDIKGSICYLAYFNVGERGLFLYDANDWYGVPHRIHTTTVESVAYTGENINEKIDRVIVKTRNTRFKFKQLE